MDAIKKKMQAMKLEKEHALDRAAYNEQLAKDANLRAEKASGQFKIPKKKVSKWITLGRRGSPSIAEEDPDYWKWARPNSGTTHASQCQVGRKGKGSPKCKLFQKVTVKV